MKGGLRGGVWLLRCRARLVGACEGRAVPPGGGPGGGGVGRPGSRESLVISHVGRGGNAASAKPCGCASTRPWARIAPESGTCALDDIRQCASASRPWAPAHVGVAIAAALATKAVTSSADMAALAAIASLYDLL